MKIANTTFKNMIEIMFLLNKNNHLDNKHHQGNYFKKIIFKLFSNDLFLKASLFTFFYDLSWKLDRINR